jgi:hypothetical protein
MARSRNIKPGFFKNELLAEMPPETRLLFMGLWCLADREGRFEDRPKKIKMELFPCDEFSIEDSLSTLTAGGFLIRYEADGKKYAQVVNFTKHQMPHHKEVASEIPAPPGLQQVTKHAYEVSPQDRIAVFKRDGDRCLKCGSMDNLSLDHITPLASGGDNSTDNLQTLCKRCNSSKGNTIKDYRESNVEPTLSQHTGNDGASCPSDSLIPDSLNLIPDSLQNPAPEKPARFDPLKISLPECIKPETWAEWIAYRRDRKLTTRQQTMQAQVVELTAWAKSGHDPTSVIQTSIAKGWQGLFEPKQGNQNANYSDFVAELTGRHRPENALAIDGQAERVD